MHRIVAIGLTIAVMVLLGGTNVPASIMVAGAAYAVFTMPVKTRTLTKTRRVIVEPEVPASEHFLQHIRTIFAAQNQVGKQLRLIQTKNGRHWLGHGQGRGTVITHEVVPDDVSIILIGEDEVKEEGAA